MMEMSQTVFSEPTFGFNSAPGSDGNVRIRNPTIYDAAFVSRLMVEAFQGKIEATVGRHRLKPLIEAMTDDFQSKSVAWHRTFLAEVDGKPMGLGLINFNDDYKESENSDSTAYTRRLGCCSLIRLGCLESALSPSPPKRGECYLSVLCVDGAARGRGIGKVLLERCDWEARRRGCTSIWLLVEATNRAIHLYERHGYQVTETKDYGCCLSCIIGVSKFKKMVKQY